MEDSIAQKVNFDCFAQFEVSHHSENLSKLQKSFLQNLTQSICRLHIEFYLRIMLLYKKIQFYCSENDKLLINSIYRFSYSYINQKSTSNKTSVNKFIIKIEVSDPVLM